MGHEWPGSDQGSGQGSDKGGDHGWGQRRGSGGSWGNSWSSSWGGSWGGPPWKDGPPPWLTGLLGFAQAGATRSPKVRRGDVRAAVLDVLAAEEMNGYQVIQQIAERSRGLWKPSPGSVYPTVQQLEDEGLVEGVQDGGRRVLRLTAEGRAYVASHARELAATWAPFDKEHRQGEQAAGDIKPVLGQVMAAVWQVMTQGTDQQRAEATEILADTRRRLYGLLADGDPQPDSPPGALADPGPEPGNESGERSGS